jgi:N-methylhydantoinase B
VSSGRRATASQGSADGISAADPGRGVVDPIQFELIRGALGAIADEMALTIVRTSRSGVLKDNMDFSTALCDAAGQLIAQGLTLPLHLGSMPDAMDGLLRRYPAAAMLPGDVFVLNDPFEGGMHLPDVFIIKPLFADARLLAFACTVAHQTDMGGRVPGSNASDSTEIFAEGLRIPPLYFQRAGQPNETLLRLIEKNVRVPEMVLGDLASQVSACLIAERELARLVERYGTEALSAAFLELLDYAERMTRAELAGWPDGVYCFEDFIDDDGIDERPIPIRVTLTVAGDRLVADFSGTSTQVKGAINATPSFARSAVYLTVRSVMEADVPNNAGFMRPISVITPPGSIVNPNLPAAFAARGLTGFRLIDALFGALAQVRPERVPAACEGGNTGVSIGGWDPERGPFIFVEFVCGTGGARPGLDGVDGHTNPGVCMSNVPCEVVEVESPVVVERYGLLPDSGGPGCFRGGLALVRDYRFVGEEAILQVRSDRRRIRPYGLAGGQPGTPSSNVLNPEGEARELPSKLTMTMRRGDLLHHVQPAGGGLGDPLTRDPRLVLADVLDEKLSPEAARRDYGVVLTGDGQQIEQEATAALRARRAAPIRGETPSA